MKTQQEWMDHFKSLESSAHFTPPSARVTVSARDIWEIQCNAMLANADAIIDELGGERGFDHWWQDLKKDEKESIKASLNRLLCPEHSATQAELDGADKVIANLKAEREELRQCLDAFLTTKRDNAYWIDRAMAILGV